MHLVFPHHEHAWKAFEALQRLKESDELNYRFNISWLKTKNYRAMQKTSRELLYLDLFSLDLKVSRHQLLKKDEENDRTKRLSVVPEKTSLSALLQRTVTNNNNNNSSNENSNEQPQPQSDQPVAEKAAEIPMKKIRRRKSSKQVQELEEFS